MRLAFIFLCLVSFSGNWACYAADNQSPLLSGRLNCDASSQQIMKAQWEPFDKNPAEIDLGVIEVAAEFYAVVLRKSRPEIEFHCGIIIGELKLPNILGAREKSIYDDKKNYNKIASNAVGFNCVVLNEKYNSGRAYVAIYRRNDLEYTRSIISWYYDFEKNEFKKMNKNKLTYCSNFIAD